MEDIYIPETDQPRIVVIGGGFAGINFAKKLVNKNFQIVIIDKNNFHQFPPLLYQVATSGLEPDAISFTLRKIFRNAKNIFFRMADVLKIDPTNNTLLTSIGSIRYDYLVIATGTTNNFYGLEQVQKHALSLKSIQEALDIRSAVLQNLERASNTNNHVHHKRLTNIVICGGGPAGVELAGAFAEFKQFIFNKDYKELSPDLLQIYLIEANEELLATMSDKSSINAREILETNGVKVLLNTLVRDFDGNTVTLGDGSTIESENVIWAAGIKGNMIPGFKEEIVRGNRLEVNRQLRVIGKEKIYAIGDIAYMVEEDWPKGHPQVAPAAIQHGKFLGDLFLKNLPAKDMFSYRDKGQLATIGKRNAVLDKGNFHISGLLGWFLWATVHLYSISGFKNKLRVGINWMNSYFTYEKQNRLIIRKYELHVNRIKGPVKESLDL